MSNDIPMYERDLVFLDTETTGLNPDRHEIIQISAFNVSPTRRTETFIKIFVKPIFLYTSEPKALELNRYSKERWIDAGAVDLHTALVSLRDTCFAHSSVLAIWNPVFDAPFLRNAFNRVGLGWPETIHYHVLDVSSMVWSLVAKKRRIESIKLAKVCEHLGIDNEGEHDSGRDVERMIQVYRKLVGWPLDYTTAPSQTLKKPRGFAAVPPHKRRELGAKGGKSAAERGTAYKWDKEKAMEAGRKGGLAKAAGAKS